MHLFARRSGTRHAAGVARRRDIPREIFRECREPAEVDRERSLKLLEISNLKFQDLESGSTREFVIHVSFYFHLIL